MGNQPSSPQPSPPAPDVPQLPPLPPPCDMECQKQKDLALLKQNLDSTDPVSDPSGYEKARISYFTLLNGPGWLAQEKGRIAKEDVEPVLSSYTTQFNSLKGEQQSQGTFTKLANVLKSQQAADEQSNSFLKKQLISEKDKAQVSDRLSQLGAPSSSSSYVPWIIDILITLLAIFVAYKGYLRFFGTNRVSPDVPVLSST
jgi:hypothetical protein